MLTYLLRVLAQLDGRSLDFKISWFHLTPASPMNSDLIRQPKFFEEDRNFDTIRRAGRVCNMIRSERAQGAWVDVALHRWMSDLLAMLRCCPMVLSLAVIYQFCQHLGCVSSYRLLNC